MQNINHDAWRNFGDKSGLWEGCEMVVPQEDRIEDVISANMNTLEIGMCNIYTVGVVDEFIKNMIEMVTK